MTRLSRSPGDSARSRYHGRLERDRTTPSMRLVVSNYAFGTRLPRHAHAHLCIVLQGGYEERIGRRSFERAPLDIVWRPEEAEHEEAFGSSGRHFIVDLERVPDGADTSEVRTLRGPRAIAGALRVVQLLRVKYACRELARGEDALANIALAAGFADQSHMGRVLRRHVGLAPAGLRRALRS